MVIAPSPPPAIVGLAIPSAHTGNAEAKARHPSITGHYDSNEIQLQLGELAHELNAYRSDAERFERMKRAQAETARIQKEMDKLTVAYAKAKDAEDKADRQARRDSIKDLSLRVSGGSCTITYLQRVYDGETNAPAWHSRVVEGFPALDPRVMGYLLEEVASRSSCSSLLNLT